MPPEGETLIFSRIAMKTTERSWSVSLSWSAIRTQERCKDGETRRTLGDHAPATTDASDLASLQYIIASFAVDNSYTKDGFVDAFMKDSITSNIVKWTEKNRHVIYEASLKINQIHQFWL